MGKEYGVVNGNLIISIPLEVDQVEEDTNGEFQVMGKRPNLIGVYNGDFDNGIAYRIDMGYKGKPDQWTDTFYKPNFSLEEFEEMCKELKIDYIIEKS